MLLLAVFSLSPASSGAVDFDSDTQARIRSATFEVVMRKPEKDSLTYEKPLPLELLPYVERTDPYISVGTAFAIGGDRYVTAAHVLDSGLRTQYGEPALRDAQGTVYPIDKVHKYSSHQDFAVISVKGKPPGAALEVNREPKLNEPVVAVGNALGEGIVIRDGLYTSQTPEDRDGRWKWIRFSAAASPGNSGGPLLDKNGRVIGVVLRKSENENLNYAAPIALVLDAPDNLAQLDAEAQYWLPVMDDKETGRRTLEIQLPKSFPALSKEILDFWNSFFMSLRAELLKRHADTLFPRGEGSQQLLYSAVQVMGPSLVARGDDNVWQIAQPTGTQTATLQANGFVTYGDLANATFMKLRRPDDVPAATFYSDSKAYMDTFLRAMSWKRTVGREDVRIVSLGPAAEDREHVDAWGRQWQLRSWNVEFQDTVVLSMALPVPDGYLAILRSADTAWVESALDDLRTMADFSYVTYSGTLAQWRDFLSMPHLWPRALREIEIGYDYEKSFSYRSKRVQLTFGHDQQKIEPDSLMNLVFGYFDDRGKVVWDVAALVLVEKLTGGSAVSVVRHGKPPSTLPHAFTSKWHKIVAREYPFNAALVENQGNSIMSSIYPYPQTEGVAPVSERVRYELAYAWQGKHSEEEMSAALQRWFQGFTVLEK
ncbi:MAG TPA: serine protease [Steroidobacter sp.]